MKRLEVYLPADWASYGGAQSVSPPPAPGYRVGELAETGNRYYFQYDADFLRNPLWLSPFKLPPESGLHEHRDRAFGPLFGLFDDSLPDGWGLLLLDRHLRSQAIAVDTFSPLDRLAYLGSQTMGALTYHPPADRRLLGAEDADVYEMAQAAYRVVRGTADDVLPQLLQSGGSPGGARPKILVGLKGDELITAPDPLPAGYQGWLIKFHAREDAVEDGLIEYAYAQMAQAAGISMPPTRLFTTTRGNSFFGVERFDRQGHVRHHVHTFGNLIHANFRVPGYDYAQLMQVTRVLTRNQVEVEAAFRLMVFNILVHNRDDHVKNFAFLLPAGGAWQCAPAYDLTFSSGPNGEHTMTVAGEGRSPTLSHIQTIARDAGIEKRRAAEILDAVRSAASEWPRIAAEVGVSTDRIQQIHRAFPRV